MDLQSLLFGTVAVLVFKGLVICCLFLDNRKTRRMLKKDNQKIQKTFEQVKTEVKRLDRRQKLTCRDVAQLCHLAHDSILVIENIEDRLKGPIGYEPSCN
jgi:hypothetical protein